MKNWKKLLPLVFILILVLSWTGLEINTKMEEYGCAGNYKKYIIPNYLCQFITHGHCNSTGLNEARAEREVALCLCDKYLQNQDRELGKSIVSKCENYNCRGTIMNMRYENCPSESSESYSRDCMIQHMEISENLSDNVDFICENKEKIFYPIHIF